MFLDEDTFKTIITSTPLISIDLVIKNTGGEYLLGLRNNRPAQEYQFVLGGRIQKNESIDSAFLRLTEDELGNATKLGYSRFLGPYEHFYHGYVFGTQHDAHYVVLACTLVAEIALCDLPNISIVNTNGLTVTSCSYGMMSY